MRSASGHRDPVARGSDRRDGVKLPTSSLALGARLVALLHLVPELVERLPCSPLRKQCPPAVLEPGRDICLGSLQLPLLCTTERLAQLAAERRCRLPLQGAQAQPAVAILLAADWRIRDVTMYPASLPGMSQALRQLGADPKHVHASPLPPLAARARRSLHQIEQHQYVGDQLPCA